MTKKEAVENVMTTAAQVLKSSDPLLSASNVLDYLQNTCDYTAVVRQALYELSAGIDMPDVAHITAYVRAHRLAVYALMVLASMPGLDGIQKSELGYAWSQPAASDETVN